MKLPAETPISPSFILGIPRSGTTWLANILEAAPDTALFLEPFSTIAGDVFSEIPATSLFLNSESQSLAHYFQTDFLDSLARYKTLLKESTNSIGRFKLERSLSQSIGFFSRRLRFGQPKRCRVFELLNLNRLASDYPLRAKDIEARHWVIKELRAAGKLFSLCAAFPESRFLTIIRHPCATVDSILKWFQRGRLVELRCELTYFNEALRAQIVGQPYEGLLDKVERSGHPAGQIALYWRVHYETIVNSLAQHPHHLIVTHEELASQTQETVEKIFQFFKIELSQQVSDYVSYSTRNHADISSPVSTVRNSNSSYYDWCQTIEGDVRSVVDGVVADSPLMNYFEPFYALALLRKGSH